MMDRRFPIRVILLSALIGTSSLALADAAVTILSRPDMLEPGGMAPVSCRINKTANEPEKRIVIRVDLHDADTDAKVSGAILDNGGAGYKGNIVNVTANVAVPSNAAGSYYFKATASPWSLNKALVERLRSYPRDGTYTYKWEGGMGVTQDVWYKGVRVARTDGDNTCYCSGLAFEVFVLAWNEYNTQYGHSQIGNIPNATVMEAFRKVWYGNWPETEKLAARAIPEWGVGVEITDWEEAQEGDSVQLWRHSSSGHNPIFANWVRNSNNQITGVRYWGTQGSTNGIGYHTEYFGTSRGMNPARFYLARSKKPRDQADYDWALGTADTRSAPSIINSSVQAWNAYD